MFPLFAQAAEAVAYTPEWWIKQLKDNGFGTLLSGLILFLLYKYAPRVIEAFVAYLQVSTETARKLTEIGEKHQDQLEAIVTTQRATETTSRSMIDAQNGSRTVNELRATKYLDLIELILPHIAPQAKEESRKHIDALRAISAHR
jgi:hypothetical protein